MFGSFPPVPFFFFFFCLIKVIVYTVFKCRTERKCTRASSTVQEEEGKCFMDVKVILSLLRCSMTQDATGYVCLLIQPTKKDDAGWYTVSAKNEAGVASCTCRLDIYG